jgi:hypothetical protein
VRLIGVGVSGLGAPLRQMELWGAQSEKSRKLQDTLDMLHEKFGDEVHPAREEFCMNDWIYQTIRLSFAFKFFSAADPYLK